MNCTGRFSLWILSHSPNRPISYSLYFFLLFDFTLLNEEEQKAIFIADKFEHPEAGSNLGTAAGADNVFSDDEIANYWADYHQAGWQTLPKVEQTPYRDKKIKSFAVSLAEYIKSITP